MLSRAATVLIAFGVLLAGSVLWRLTRDRRVRAIVAIFTVYGAAVFAYAAVRGVSVREALSLSLSEQARDRTPDARVADLDRGLRTLQQGARDLARDTWDPDYVVRMVGRDAGRLFVWVQRNTYWIPYHGVLRGPVGVLMDRQGNSLDRAILLAVLLQRAGYVVRMAHGELSSEQARNLLPKLEAARVARFAPRPAARPHHIGVTAAGAGVQEQQRAFSRVAAELHARVDDQTQRLLKLVSAPRSEDVWALSFAVAVGAVRDHWWVQVQSGSNWVSLDLITGHVGAAAAAARETIAMIDLPADLHHTVTVRVIAEQWAHGTLNQHKTLQQVLRPSDLYGHSVTLQFFPGDWFEKDNVSSHHSRAGALAQDAWDAMLSVDDTLLVAGALLENGDDPTAPVKGAEMGGLAGAFSNSVSRGARDTPQLSAVWIEYDIHVPGEKTRTVRRTVFDLLEPAARATPSPKLILDESRRLTRSLALTMKTDILSIASGLSPQFVAALVSGNLVANRDLFSFLVKGALPPGTTDLEHLFNHSHPLLSTLYAVALARMELTNKADVFIDRPNILTRHQYAAPAGDAIAIEDAIDIVANEVGVGVSVEDPFAVRVRQGVLDTNAESVWQPSRGVSVGDAFAKSGSWLAVRSREDAISGSRIHLPEDVRLQIGDDVQAGYAAAAPDQPISVAGEEFAGWWRVDRATGSALGIGANGWGAVLPERGAKDTQTAWIAPIWKARIQTFAVAYAANYGWCLTPLVVKHIETNGVFGVKAAYQPLTGQFVATKVGHSLGIWEGAIKPSVGECVADSVFIAGITAWLLPVGVVGEGQYEGRTPAGQSEPIGPKAEPNGGAGGEKGGTHSGEPGSGPTEGGTGPHGGANGEPNSDPNPQPKDDPCQGGGDSQGGGGDQGPPTDPYPNTINQLEGNLENARTAEAQARDQWIKAVQDYLAVKANKPNIVEQWDPRNGPNPGDPSKFDQAAFDKAKNALDQSWKNYLDKESARFEAQDALESALKELGQMNGGGTAQQGGAQPRGAAGQCGGDTGAAQQFNPQGDKPRAVTSLDPSLRAGDGPIDGLDPSLYQAAQSGNTMPGIGPPPDIASPSTGGNGSGQPTNWDGKICPWCSTVAPVYPDSSPPDPNTQSSPQSPGQSAGSTASPGQKTANGLVDVIGAMGGGPPAHE